MLAYESLLLLSSYPPAVPINPLYRIWQAKSSHVLFSLTEWRRNRSDGESNYFFDIDGTLLDEEKRLPQSTKQAIAALKEKGHEVAIATGRAPYFFKELREELEIDSYICFNGQYVVFKGELIYENTLDMDAFTEMERYASSQEHPLVFMGAKTYTSNREDHPYVIKSIKTLKIDLPQYNPDLYNEQPLHQALLFCEEGEEKTMKLAFQRFASSAGIHCL